MGSATIRAEDLKDSLANYKILDACGQWSDPVDLLPAYNESHIPTAIKCNWTEFLQPGAERLGLAPVLQDKEDVRKLLQRLGIQSCDQLVVYDLGNHMFAGRVWWSLNVWGFPNVKVLEGGFKNWKSKGFETSNEIPTVVAETDVEPVWQPQLDASLEQVEKLYTTEDMILMDNRGAQGYNGDKSDPRSGHIPGAILVPWSDTLQEDGTFKSADDLVQLFDQLLPEWKSPKVVASCGSGYSTTVVMLAMEKAGKTIPTPMFDGSASVWKLDESRPMEQI